MGGVLRGSKKGEPWVENAVCDQTLCFVSFKKSFKIMGATRISTISMFERL
jgi:hypothetical protein